MALVDCAINKKRCTVGRRMGHLPSFFVPTPGDLTAQESLSPGICHPSQKECHAGGAARGGLGAAGID